MKFEILSDHAATVTKISTFDETTIRVRGITIEDLLEHATYLEAAYLVLNGHLPNERDLARFATAIDHEMEPNSKTYAFIETLPKSANFLDALRAVISFVGLPYSNATEPTLAVVREQGIQLMAQIPAIIVALTHHRHGLDPLHPRRGRGFVRNFLWMLMGREPEESELWIFEKTLIVHIENELNLSTFSARLAASAQADFYSSIIAALSTLKGPLHGGANQRVAEMVEEIGSVGEVEAYIKEKLEKKSRVMGFGHLIYKNGDPRAPLLRSLAKMLAQDDEQKRIYEIYNAIEREMREKKNILPNVDFYSACVFQLLGLEAEVFPSIFALARFPSWIAHIEEQWADNKMMVARAEYKGIASSAYRPMNERP